MTNKLIYEPLSNFDLDDFTEDMNNRPANIKQYNDIKTKKIKTISDLFGKNNYVILFLENDNKNDPIGHWVVLFFNKKNKSDVHFLDTYTNSIKNLCPLLIPLLFKKFKKIHSNKISYQAYGDNSGTCGRHCIFSVGVNNIIDNFDFDKLKKIMDYLKTKHNKKTYNDVVSKYINIDL